MKAWVFQDDKQVKKVGEEAASWYVGWIDPGGTRRCKSCGKGKKGNRLAKEETVRIHAQLVAGTYQSANAKTWEEFRAEYKVKVMDGMGAHNREETELPLRSFERTVKPKKMQAVTTMLVVDFIAKRRKEPGQEEGTLLSSATINKELRHLRAVLRKAKRVGYLKEAPEFDFLKESKKLPTYTTPEHFAKMYAACEAAAREPKGLPYPPGAWWRGILITAFMTGWRISSILALRREDVDLVAGIAKSQATDNKGNRDQLIALHPLVIEHMQAIASFEPVVFPWYLSKQLLYAEFERIQIEAEVKPSGKKKRYGFHDLRRAFATMNADRLTPDALQALMQHQDYQTTQRYINMARQLTPAVQNLFVPDMPKKKERA
jgi:integrase